MVPEILEDLGFENLVQRSGKHGAELRFCRMGGDNPSAMRFLLETLKWNCYTTGERGDLYSLVMRQRNCDFPTALNYVAKKAGIDKGSLAETIKLPFGGFYKQLAKEVEEPEYSMPTYPESTLAPYLGKTNTMFLRDGIDLKTQEEFQVGYDVASQRITVPNWTLDGRLCGIMGRLNSPDCPHDDRWLPVVPCSRPYTLYGFHQNYSAIQQKGLVVIGESEKFVMQMRSMGSSVGLATCGNHVSEVQARHIKRLMVPKVILAYDEGLDEELVIEEAKKLTIGNQMVQNKVGYIWDPDHEVLPLGSKASPTDLGKEKFTYLVTKKVRWLQ